MTVPPYDNKEYRYRHTDEDRREGLARIAILLGVADLPKPANALYDLSFLRCGIRVFDRLADPVDADAALWIGVRAAWPCGTPEEIAADPKLAEGFLGLVNGERTGASARGAAVSFINAHRRDFQGECRASDTILFVQE